MDNKLSAQTENAARCEALRKLCGYVENGTDQVVTISQDDATREWVVRAGKAWWHGSSFAAAIDAARQAVADEE